MTTAAITTKLDDVKNRAARLAQFGKLDEWTVNRLEKKMADIESELESLDDELSRDLAVAEREALSKLAS